MKYKILEINKRHIDSINKDIIEAKIEDIAGNITMKASIWGDFPNFDTLVVGSEIEADMVVKTKNGFENRTLYPLKETNKAPTPEKEITLSQLAFSVQRIDLRIKAVEDFIEQYKNGKIPSDFSAEKVDKRIAELKKVDEINPEDIPF
jgi:hypothetical protein